MNKNQKLELLSIARKSIESFLNISDFQLYEPEDKELKELKGVFVTLNKNNVLRGCIGYIIGIKPLYKAVYDMARQAAFYDPRFMPVNKDELNDIQIEISVLSPLRKIDDFKKIEIGKHGLFIKKDGYSGLLLPQVAVEWHYDSIKFLEQTCIKAGMHHNCYKDKNTEVYIFEAEIFSEGVIDE